jgi:ribosomal protein S18 acetylase RimI-like enzyme
MMSNFKEAEPLLRVEVERRLRAIGFAPEAQALATYVHHLFATGDRRFFVAKDKAGVAVAELHTLKWDSKIYGIPVATIGVIASSTPLLAGVKQTLVARAVEEASATGVNMLTARIPLEDLPALHALEEHGFRVMDVQCPLFLDNLSAELQPSSRQEAEIRDYQVSDREQIVDFGKAAFGRSHLYADPRLDTTHTDKLHEEWIDSDCHGRALFVLVASVNNTVCGLIAGLWDSMQEKDLGLLHGHIDLIAVKREMRGLGIGRQLMSAALARFAERGAMLVTVSTQATNLGAINLYRRLGFKLAGFEGTLHGWI